MRLQAHPSGHIISVYGTEVPQDGRLFSQAKNYLQKQRRQAQELESRLDDIYYHNSLSPEIKELQRKLDRIDHEAYLYDSHNQKVCGFRCDFGKVSRI